MSFNDSALTAFDFFAGGGGASYGLHQAGINVLAALNHSPVAIATHAVNFPTAKHLLCDIRVQQSWGLGQADIMWASPDCTHHSIAKGGQSRDAKERALAEELPRFAYNLNVNCVMVENVKEFLNWGPLRRKLDKNGQPKVDKKGKEVWEPIPERKKEYYNAWLETMHALGFVNYEYRLLNAADFGVPQSRVRYFGIFTRKGVPIRWPKPTHDKLGAHGLPKWTAVRTVLDLDDRGYSIFTEWKKKEPIADKTLRRILAGLKKHVIGNREEQFLDKRTSNPPSGKPGTGASAKQPSPTLATCYLPDLVTPRFVLNPAWGGGSSSEYAPCPTAVASQDKAPLSVATAEFITKAFGGDPTHQSLPLTGATGAITCSDHHYFNTAYLIHHYGAGGQHSSLCAPCYGVTCNPHARLCTLAFTQQYNGGSDECRVLSPEGPLNTATTENRFAPVFVEFAQRLLQLNGTRAHDEEARLTMSLDGVAPVVNTNGGNLKLMTYYGTGIVQGTCLPCPTAPTKDKFALVRFVSARCYGAVTPQIADSEAMALLKKTCRQHGIADIYMRMLKVEELKLIMGFPADYHLSGSQTKQKEMLGNAVVPQVSEAIARAMIPGLKAARLRKLPKLRWAAVNRWQQVNLFEKLETV